MVLEGLPQAWRCVTTFPYIGPWPWASHPRREASAETTGALSSGAPPQVGFSSHGGPAHTCTHTPWQAAAGTPEQVSPGLSGPRRLPLTPLSHHSDSSRDWFPPLRCKSQPGIRRERSCPFTFMNYCSALLDRRQPMGGECTRPSLLFPTNLHGTPTLPPWCLAQGFSLCPVSCCHLGEL